MFAAVAALALLVLPQERRTETWPDGSKKAEYEVAPDGQGGEIRQGSFRSYHANGQLESEGRFEEDRELGAWTFFHPNGQKAAQGAFADGLRTGPWETFFASGKPESKGSYKRGARDGRWTCWNEDGSKNPADSGIYKLEVYRKEQRHYRGYRVDNRRQGTWTAYWPDGKKQFEGRFQDGEREGEWIFYHPDGTPSSLLLSGRYSRGKWMAALSFQAPLLDAALLPAIEPSPRGWPEDRTSLEETLKNLLAVRLANEGAVERFVKAGARSIPIVLLELARCDPETEEGRGRLGFLEEHVLRAIACGHALGPRGPGAQGGPGGPPDAAAARELVRAWLSLWALTRLDLLFWELQLPSAPPGGDLGRDLLQDPPILERDARYEPLSSSNPEPSAPSAAGPRGYETRFGKARQELLRQAPAGTEKALEAALRWLVAHQSPDGRWDADAFAANCGKIGPGTCEGPGNPAHDLGASALALLALLGDGNTPSRGEHAAAVVLGLDWLVKQQQPNGLVGETSSHDFLYDHAIATAVLCEATGLGAQTLREPAEKAVALIHRARNVGMAWRYDLPPGGDNDTSLTGWMVSALVAARRAGLTIDPAALDGAQAWIDHATDPNTGRVGYDSPGSLSSRTPANESFPRENGEAMTATGLLCRILLGQEPRAFPILRQHAELLQRHLPSWDPEYGCDVYYWYYGTYALHEMGKPYWPAWEAALKEAVLDSQRENGDRKGSWDAVGPWGYVCGRVGNTALLALTLECYHRHPRLLASQD